MTDAVCEHNPPGNGFSILARNFALVHVLLDHCHDSIGVFKVTGSNHRHVLRPVPALVKSKDLAGWDALDDVLLASGKAFCVLRKA